MGAPSPTESRPPGTCRALGTPLPCPPCCGVAPRAPTAMAEFLREAVGVEGRELSEELALNSSELRLSEASLRPLLMELLSSQLQQRSQREAPCPAVPCHPTAPPGPNLSSRSPGREPTLGSPGWLQPSLTQAPKPRNFPVQAPTEVFYGLKAPVQRGGTSTCTGTAGSTAAGTELPAPSPTEGVRRIPGKGRERPEHQTQPPHSLHPFSASSHSLLRHPRGDIGTSPAPGQLLRAGGAAERAPAHLRGCQHGQNARARPPSSRMSTAPFRSAAQ